MAAKIGSLGFGVGCFHLFSVPKMDIYTGTPNPKPQTANILLISPQFKKCNYVRRITNDY